VEHQAVHRYTLLVHRPPLVVANLQLSTLLQVTSVGDPDPQNPHVFGPPGSRSINQRYRSGSFPFLIKVLSGLK
jgi:hypothetical protein